MREIRLVNLQREKFIRKIIRGAKQAILVVMNVILTVIMLGIRKKTEVDIQLCIQVAIMYPLWLFLIMYSVFKWFMRRIVYDSIDFNREMSREERRIREQIRSEKKELYAEMEMYGVYDEDVSENIEIRSQKVVDFQRYVENIDLATDNTDPECKVAEFLLEELESRIKGEGRKAKAQKKIARLFVHMMFW